MADGAAVCNWKAVPAADGGCSAWNPGVAPAIPREFRHLETLFRAECAETSVDEAAELAAWCGLPAEECAVLRPVRLVLHEVIIRVTADIAVAEGEAEEDFGYNFRRIARGLLDEHVMPRLAELEADYAALRSDCERLAGEMLTQALAPPQPPAPPRRRFPFSLLPRRAPPMVVESAAESDYRVIAGFKSAGLECTEPVRRELCKSFYRVLGAMLARRGRLGAERELLLRLVVGHACNRLGAQRLGAMIAPWCAAGIAAAGLKRVENQAAPVLISLKGASAAGKSSLRPMLKRLLVEQGMAADGYATISPDVWRRLLLDYESLGPAYKYAGHLTSRELVIIDGKLDRYIRAKAQRDKAIPHFLVDRFRFDSFSSEQVARVLHNTYAKHVETMYMYFVVTPPEATVERGWQRALERGRYKAVEDFLGHSIEAYGGMPKIFFKWLAYQRPVFRYVFLDNRVPKGQFPATVASGDQTAMRIYDPLVLIDIERYQRINIHATTPAEVYPPPAELAVALNASFLKEILRRVPEVEFIDAASDTCYLRSREGVITVVDAALLARRCVDTELAAVVAVIAPSSVSRSLA